MANTTQRDLDAEFRRLAEETEAGEIDPADREAIETYIREHDMGVSKPSTVIGHLGRLRRTARRSDVPLVEMDVDQLDRLMSRLRSGDHPDVKDDGIGVGNTQAALRLFYRYHSRLGVDPRLIDLDGNEGRDLSPEDLWYQADVDAVLEATRDGSSRGLRARAMIALALATGQRIDAVRTLRVGDVQRNGPTMDLSLNDEDGNLKGASGTRPLLWARSFVESWLDQHPYRDDDEAALFCAAHWRGHNKKADGDERGFLDDQTLRDDLRDYARAAEIDRPDYFHILRHSAITRLVADGVPEQRVKQVVGWDPDSSQFGTYVHLADQLNNDALRADLGLPTSGEEVIIGRPTLEKCHECGAEMPEGSTRCENLSCGAPLTISEHDDEPPSDREAIEMVAQTFEDVLAMIGPTISERAEVVAETGDASEMIDFAAISAEELVAGAVADLGDDDADDD